MNNLMTLHDYMFKIPGDKINKELVTPFGRFLHNKGKMVYVADNPVFEYDGENYEIITRIVHQGYDPITLFKMFLDEFEPFETIALYELSYLFVPDDYEHVLTHFIFRFCIIE